MSRYVIPQPDPMSTVSVGWDNPLGTFYAQIHDDEGNCLYGIGDDYDAIPTVETLQAKLGDIATIPEAIVDALRADQRTASPPTPLQRWTKALFIDIKKRNAKEA